MVTDLQQQVAVLPMPFFSMRSDEVMTAYAKATALER